jgi:hypothetical protein
MQHMLLVMPPYGKGKEHLNHSDYHKSHERYWTQASVTRSYYFTCPSLHAITITYEHSFKPTNAFFWKCKNVDHAEVWATFSNTFSGHTYTIILYWKLQNSNNVLLYDSRQTQLSLFMDSNVCISIVHFVMIYLMTLSGAQAIQQWMVERLINWKGCGRKQPCPILRYYPSICLKGLPKIM